MVHEGMKFSLVTRELIADSTEAMATAHPFDGMVFIPNCDKNVPGLLMAAARLNVPSIFISGGAMLAGDFENRKISYSNVLVSDEELENRRKNLVPFEIKVKKGYLARYSKLVASGCKGAVLE